MSGSQERPSASGVRMGRERALRAREEAAILCIGTVEDVRKGNVNSAATHELAEGEESSVGQ